MEMKTEKLNDDQIHAEIALLNPYGGWRIEQENLVKEFSFESYLDGLNFAIKVAKESEKMNHHPELTIMWKRVLFRVTTNNPKGLTQLDFNLAKWVEVDMIQGTDAAV